VTVDLIDCMTTDTSVIEALPDELNWQMADDATGQADIWVQPASDINATLIEGYIGGAFGQEIRQSGPATMSVAGIHLDVLGYPEIINHDAAFFLDVKAGYKQGDGSVNYTSGILIEAEVSGGTAGIVIGPTTNEIGYWRAQVHTDLYPDVPRMEINLTAMGEQDEHAETTLYIEYCPHPDLASITQACQYNWTDNTVRVTMGCGCPTSTGDNWYFFNVTQYEGVISDPAVSGRSSGSIQENAWECEFPAIQRTQDSVRNVFKVEVYCLDREGTLVKRYPGTCVYTVTDSCAVIVPPESQTR
jgi:hypothetical protein